MRVGVGSGFRLLRVMLDWVVYQAELHNYL